MNGWNIFKPLNHFRFVPFQPFKPTMGLSNPVGPDGSKRYHNEYDKHFR
jgi:hypothetical protein